MKASRNGHDPSLKLAAQVKADHMDPEKLALAIIKRAVSVYRKSIRRIESYRAEYQRATKDLPRGEDRYEIHQTWEKWLDVLAWEKAAAERYLTSVVMLATDRCQSVGQAVEVTSEAGWRPAVLEVSGTLYVVSPLDPELDLTPTVMTINANVDFASTQQFGG